MFHRLFFLSDFLDLLLFINMSFIGNLLEFMTALPKMIADVVSSIANLITSVVDGLGKVTEFLGALPDILSDLAEDVPGILATAGGAFFGWFVGENLYGLFGSVPFALGGAFIGYMGRQEIFEDPLRFLSRIVRLLTPLAGFGMGVAIVDIVLPMTNEMAQLSDFRYIGGFVGALIGYLFSDTIVESSGLNAPYVRRLSDTDTTHGTHTRHHTPITYHHKEAAVVTTDNTPTTFVKKMDHTWDSILSHNTPHDTSIYSMMGVTKTVASVDAFGRQTPGLPQSYRQFFKRSK